MTSVPSTEKCSSDKGSATSRCAKNEEGQQTFRGSVYPTNAITGAATSRWSAAGRGFGEHGGPTALRFARSGLTSVHWTDVRAPFTPDRIVYAEADKPAEHEVILHLLQQLPLRPYREQDLDQRARINRTGAIEGRPKST